MRLRPNSREAGAPIARPIPLAAAYFSPGNTEGPFSERYHADPIRGSEEHAKHQTGIQPAGATAFFELAPSTETAEGAFAVNQQKSSSRFIIII